MLNLRSTAKDKCMIPTQYAFLFFFSLFLVATKAQVDSLATPPSSSSSKALPEDAQYQQDEQRLLSYLDEKKYKSLMRLSNEMVHKYHDKGLPKYAYAIGLYALMGENKQFKKTYEKYRLQYWRMITMMLKNSKKSGYDINLVKSSWTTLDEIQTSLYEVGAFFLKIGNDKNTLNYLSMLMQIFDDRQGLYKNRFQLLVQDKIFERAKGHFEEGRMDDADFFFNWLDKFYFKSKFPFKYAGLASFNYQSYQFDAWSHSKYCLANTAANVKGMSTDEKQLIFLQNLLRMNPTLFKNTFLKRYLEQHPELTGNSQVASLRSTLDGKTPLPLLYASEQLNQSAAELVQQYSKPDQTSWSSTDDHKHAFLQTNKGEGSPEFISSNGYKGPSISPHEVVMALLINQGVTELEQRKVLLNANMIQLGVSNYESTDGTSIVALDFSTGDEEARNKVAKEVKARSDEAESKKSQDKEILAKAARDKKTRDNYAKDRAVQEKRFRNNRNKDVHLGYSKRRQ